MIQSTTIAIAIIILAFLVAWAPTLPSAGYLDQYDDSTHVAQRTGINLVSGSGVTVTGVDDVPNQQVDFTIALTQDAGTDITADLEEEVHASEHDGTGISVAGEALSWAASEISGTQTFGGATTISTTAGNLTLNPATATDVSGDPLLIQNVSQNASPGTTTNGQIRLWEDADAGPTGHILAQINGTTYQWNADAGLIFDNRPYLFQKNLDRFRVLLEQWETDTLAEYDAEYQAFRAQYPDLNLLELDPEWTQRYYDTLRSEYESAQTIYTLYPEAYPDSTVPIVPTIAEVLARRPVPDPATYSVPDSDLNETLASLTGTQIREGDAVILHVDREVVDGETVTRLHMIPSLLIEEIHAAKDEIERFLNLDQGTAIEAPVCNASNRGHQYLLHGGPGEADMIVACMKTAADATYSWLKVR